MLKRIFNILPDSANEPIRLLKNLILPVIYYGKGRWCPVCGKHSGKFRTNGSDPRKDAECTHCNALERHRFVWLFFSRMTNLFDGKPKTMLHIAPEKFFEAKLKKSLGQGYITADLSDPRAMVKMNITDIQYPDSFFDVIYCSHVLEHVQDDKKAMGEFFRVLKPDGWAVLIVPINAEKTFEDPSVTEPSERLRLFGQKDHVRIYGPDYIDRLRGAGFIVKVYTVSGLFDKNEINLMGLTPACGDIYFCTKE